MWQRLNKILRYRSIIRDSFMNETLTPELLQQIATTHTEQDIKNLKQALNRVFDLLYNQRNLLPS